MSKEKPKKRIEKDGKFYRMRRGKLVEIPKEWVGRVASPQHIRHRASKGLHKHAKLQKHYMESVESKVKKVETKEMVKEIVTPSRFRTLIRFVTCDLICGIATVVVPGWNSRQHVELQLASIPQNIIDSLSKTNYRCYAQVNIGADKKEELVFTNWELPK